jgi:heptosyltransferase-2
MQGTLSTTLILRLSSIGDVVLSTPLVRAMRRRFPGAAIDYLVKAEYAPLIRSNPHLTRVIPFPGGGIGGLLRLRRTIRAARYDLIVDIHDSLRTRILTLGLRNVVRYRKRRFARFVLIRFKMDLYARSGGAPGVAERYLEPVAPMGVTGDAEGLEVPFPPSAAERASEILREGGIPGDRGVLGVCPSSRHFTKMWPADRFARASADLARERGWPVLLFGSTGERERGAEIARAIGTMAPGTAVLNLAGALSLEETAAMMDRCALVLCNDTGLMHIAAARRRPVVAVFGSTTRQLGFFPYRTASVVVENEGLPCRPCTAIGRASCPRGHFRCMADIPAERVVAAARGLTPQSGG